MNCCIEGNPAPEFVATNERPMILYAALLMAEASGGVMEELSDAMFPNGPPQDWSADSQMVRRIHAAMTGMVNASYTCSDIINLLVSEDLPPGTFPRLNQAIRAMTGDEEDLILEAVNNLSDLSEDVCKCLVINKE